jgi:ectoine hydroxylase-related dioxygenase (phytanoyl-CoA dioxygenase family)
MSELFKDRSYQQLSLNGIFVGETAVSNIVESSAEHIQQFIEQFPAGDKRAEIIMAITTKITPLSANNQFNGEVPFGD